MYHILSIDIFDFVNFPLERGGIIHKVLKLMKISQKDLCDFSQSSFHFMI